MTGHILLVLFLASAIALTFLESSANASDGEDNIMVCRPCSRNFIPELNSILQELGLSEKVDIQTTDCLGKCDDPAVFKFREKTYSGMNKDSTKKVLKTAFGL
jgi:predicted metal-binding protein